MSHCLFNLKHLSICWNHLGLNIHRYWNTNKTTQGSECFSLCQSWPTTTALLQGVHSTFPKTAKQMSKNEAIRQIYLPRFHTLRFRSGPPCLYLICINQEERKVTSMHVYPGWLKGARIPYRHKCRAFHLPGELAMARFLHYSCSKTYSLSLPYRNQCYFYSDMFFLYLRLPYKSKVK